MKLDISYYERCIHTLEKAYNLLLQTPNESLDFELYRSACIKEFEIILEQSGKLLRKLLKPYFHSSKEADKLHFKDIFRHAALRGLISTEASERWLAYRDNRNHTAHDYGVNFAEETLVLVPDFIKDAWAIADMINRLNHAAEG
jgi:nucleotidyltransferase substrate binding protein (TIGR01987 family)